MTAMLWNLSAQQEPPPGRHVLLVVGEQRLRYAMADALLDAGFSLTLAATAEMAGLLLGTGAEFDVMVTQPDDELAAWYARTACPAMPVVALPCPGEEGVEGEALVRLVALAGVVPCSGTAPVCYGAAS